MGKKAKRAGKKSASNSPCPASNKKITLREKTLEIQTEQKIDADDIALKLVGNPKIDEVEEQETNVVDPGTGGVFRMPSSLNIDYDEIDRSIEIPLNRQEDINYQAPSNAYKMVYLSNENLKSQTGRSRIDSSKSNGSQKSVNIARSLSRSRGLADGGAYEVFHASRESVDASFDRSLLEAAAEERYLAGFPRGSFGGSRLSLSMENNDYVEVRRDNAIGELERLGFEQNSRSNSRMSGGFGDLQAEWNENNDIGLRNRRSRAVSESSRKSATFATDNSNQVRAYNADSDYLQNRLSKLSIHTNNDEFVLIGGRPPSAQSVDDLGGRSNIPSNRIDDMSVLSVLSEQNGLNCRKDSRMESDHVGRSISQHSVDRENRLSRASSKYTVASSNTDDRILLAMEHSQRPEAEGLVPIPKTRSRSVSRTDLTSNVETIVASRRDSYTSQGSDRVNFSEIPTLYSHPDDNFGGTNEGEPFRATAEHKKTPVRDMVRTEIRIGKRTEESEPPKPLIMTSALTPVTKRVMPTSVLHDLDEPKTPDTVQRVNEPRSIRQIMQPLTRKNTAEVAIQTGNTIRIRQGNWNSEVLSELADIGRDGSQIYDVSPDKSVNSVPMNKPKMNNSFEKNGHPAVSVLSTMLANRVEVAKPSKSDSDMSGTQSSRSNSSHQVTVVKNDSRSSQINVFHEKMRKLSENYSERLRADMIDLNGNVRDAQFAPITTSTPAKPDKFFLRTESVESEAFQKTGSEKSINSMDKLEVDAKWVEGKRTNGDTIRKHIPRGRIRDLASAFENNQIVIKDGPVRRTDATGSERNSQLLSNSDNRSRASSNRFDASSLSSNGLVNSSQTLPSKNDSRRISTSSSLNYPNVFTRNTFVRNSKTVVPQKNGNTLSSIPITINHGSKKDENMKGDDGFVSRFESIPSSQNLQQVHPKPPDTKNTGFVSSLRHSFENRASGDYQRRSQSVATPSKTDIYRRTMPIGKSGNTPILRRQTTTIETRPDTIPINQPAREFYHGSEVEIPIWRMEEATKKKSPIRIERAKTQEVSSKSSPPRYQRTVSGGIGDDENHAAAEKSFFTHSRDVFGRDIAEDLTGLEKRESWRPQKNEWKTTTSEVTTFSTQKYGDGFEEANKLERNNKIGYYGGRPLDVSPNVFEKHPSKFDLPENMSIPPYSPPATEDAGSRITHHSMTTYHDDAGSTDNRMTTEDSSIRGKIDRMFDFVENDDMSTRKNLLASSTIGSVDTTIGRRFEKTESPKKYSNYVPVNILRQNEQKGEWERTLKSGVGASPMRRKINSPERRNTVVGNESHDQSDFEYSLSQYREMQREQLRRRVSSSEEPQFFRSPSLSAPHAGQSMQSYRTTYVMGTPVSGNKVRLNSASSKMPAALATSTPIESPQSINSLSLRNGSVALEINNNNMYQNAHLHMPNDTFVSSISGVSAVDNKTEIRRRIGKMSYIIDNTQKQMKMNEAALADAIKKSAKAQEIAAHRSILISRETLRLQRAELRRLNVLAEVRRLPPPVALKLRGSVVFNNVTILLNKNFVSRLTPNDDNSFAFVALFKCGHGVEATEYVKLRVQSSDPSNQIQFEKKIQFSDVLVDFAVTVEFYAMRIIPAAKPVEQSFAAKCKNLMGPPHKKNPPPSLETAFKCRGRITLDRDAAGERRFYVDDVTYPLEGTVIINTQCSRLPDAFEVDFRGFLTMFLTVSNMASWDRYWAVLRRGVILFWKYPDDEQAGKEPRMQIDLTKCTNNSIEKCSFDMCARPNSFAIEILVETDESKIGSVVEKKRVLLSTDSTDMLNKWLFVINQTLDIIRGPI